MANANLLARFAQPVRTVQDFQDDYMRQDIAKQGMQRNALLLQEGQAVQQDRERTRMEGETLRNALMAAGPNATLAQRAAAARATGLQTGYKFADEWEKSAAEIGAKQATTGKTVQETQAGAFKLDAEKDAQARKLVQVATNSEHAAQMIDAAVAKGFWTQQDADIVKSRMPQDAQQFGPWKMQLLAPALAPKDLLPTTGNVDLGGTRGFTSTNPLDGRVTMTGSAPVTQDANSRASNATQMRGQNMVDARSREANANQRALVLQERELKVGELQDKADQRTRSKSAAIDSAGNQIAVLDKALTHPGRETATGLSGTLNPSNYIPGTNARDFQVVMDQIGGAAFLQAFESLKGGGAITEVEGKRATDAIGRLNRAQSDDEFKLALEDLRGVMTTGYKRLSGTDYAAPAGKAASGGYSDAEKERRYQEWKRSQGK